MGLMSFKRCQHANRNVSTDDELNDMIYNGFKSMYRYYCTLPYPISDTE